MNPDLLTAIQGSAQIEIVFCALTLAVLSGLAFISRRWYKEAELGLWLVSLLAITVVGATTVFQLHDAVQDYLHPELSPQTRWR